MTNHLAEPDKKEFPGAYLRKPRVICERVMPKFQDAEAKLQEWKAKVPAGEIELEEVDTSTFEIRFRKYSV